ncbi:MAG TPA: MFS transporter, partial [Opitutaceae bacterium]|nr:MFS transporter [Opitutaceae bacterium]
MNETHAHARTAHLRRNLTLCTAEGIVATPIVALIQPGNFIIAALLTITFPLPPERYGLIASLPFWCNFLQLPLTPWLDRHFRVQRVSVLFCLGQLICWAVFIAVLPFFPRDNIPLCGRWFVIFFFVMNAISAISGVSWTAWVQEWVPERVRGFYFGHRNRYMQVPTVLFLGIVGAVIDRLAGSVYAFQFLFLSAVLLRGVSITMQNRMVTVDLPGAVNASPLPWREQLNRVIADRSLRMYILFGAAWGFAVTGLAAFYPVFL